MRKKPGEKSAGEQEIINDDFLRCSGVKQLLPAAGEGRVRRSHSRYRHRRKMSMPMIFG